MFPRQWTVTLLSCNVRSVLKDYRQILQEKLSKRISLNPHYSLRAFARDIGISSGQLSLVLNGKKGISPAKAAQIFESIGLNHEEKRVCILQVTKEHARSTKKRVAADSALLEAQVTTPYQLTQDAFEVISEWYHFAVLQALSMKSLMKDLSASVQIKVVATHLGLQEVEVKTAVERMKRIELVEVINNRLHICHDTVFSTDGVPSSALRQFHAQVLRKAIAALETQTLDERYPNAIMLPIRKVDFPLIRTDILNFQKKVLKKYGRVKPGDGEQVYALTQNLLKLTEEKK